MATYVHQINEGVWSRIGDHCTPLPKQSTSWRVFHYLPLTALVPIGISIACVDLAVRVVEGTLHWLISWVYVGGDPKKDFQAVLSDSRNWKKLGQLDAYPVVGKGNPHFLFGTATCTFQDSGAVHCPNSQWATWEKRCIKDPANRSGSSAKLFELYKTCAGRQQVIDRLMKLGVNSYRISLPWSEIEPVEGRFDPRVINVVVALCKDLRRAGIAPMITLHHFSEPEWFHQKGGFEHEENIHHFLRFAECVFPKLSQNYWGKPLVDKFCTINEPNIDAFSRYVYGSFSPGKMGNFAKAGKYMVTAYKAHKAVYERFKELNPRVQVGIVHQRLEFEATNMLISPVTKYLSRLVNRATLNLFKTGTFDLKIPFSCHIHEEGIAPKTDFVGLQYYARVPIGFMGPTSYYEPMCEMPYREDPEGLYLATVEAHEAFKAPLIVTENGISTHSDEQRSRYNERALYALSRAADKIGHENVQGYFTWSFCDNFEWDMGMHPQKFGAYHVSADGEIAAEPKKGMDSFIAATKCWRESLPTQGWKVWG